jgi:hypothetical protein
VLLAPAVSAHDLLFRPRGFFVAPGAAISIPVFDGTFAASERAIRRTRIADLVLAGPDGRQRIDRAGWTERAPRSSVAVRLGRTPGTYVVGVALAPSEIRLAGPAFTSHLAEEGLTPILDLRRAGGISGRPARESSVRAAKTLIAVTGADGHLAPARGGGAAQEIMGFPAEIVPIDDPYTLAVGGTLRVRCLVDGRPLAGWTILAGGQIGTSAQPIPGQTLTSDGDGVASVRLTHDGHWFVKFVNMRKNSGKTGVDYVARWATLTFGLLPAGAR